MPAISVVVPVYNVEKYLPACVDSILAQSYEDFELILVDDGSTDSSGDICDRYAIQDKRITVVHQENRGLSGARNTGTDRAIGEYITFIDSDDFVSKDYLESMMSALLESKADASCIKMQEVEEDTDASQVPSISIASEYLHILSGRESVQSIYQGAGLLSVSACGKLYRTSIASKFPFPVGKIHEDQAAVPLMLYNSERVASSSKVCYYYRKRKNSIMHRPFQGNRFDNLEGIEACIQYYKKLEDHETVEAAEKVKDKVNAILVILARSEGRQRVIPKKYRMPMMRALFVCYKTTSNDTYSWYLSQLFPHGWQIHELLYSIKRKITRKQN